MKKNVIIFVGSLIAIVLGMLMIMSFDTTPEHPIIGFLEVCSVLAGLVLIVIGIDTIDTPLYAFWKWYTYIPNPFTPEEWKIIGRKTMEEEGILSS